MTNEQLRAMATIALENWWLDVPNGFDFYVPDPDGEACRKGLEYLAGPGDWDQDVIDAHVSGPEDWDGLETWAIYLGS